MTLRCGYAQQTLAAHFCMVTLVCYSLRDAKSRALTQLWNSAG
jgi:hypothetical protein